MAYTWAQRPPAMDDPTKPPQGGGGTPNYAQQTGFGTPTPNPLQSDTQAPGSPSNYYPTGTPQTADSTWGAPSNPFDVNGGFKYGSAPSAAAGATGRTPPGVGEPGGPEAPFAGPGYDEDFYKEHGKDLINGTTASEDLYSKGVAGSNPYYDFAQEQAIKAINDSSASRGNFNSSYAQNLIGKTVADIRGQQAHELGMLAGQADQGKFGRYDRSERYAGSAQDHAEGRARQGMDYEMGIDRGQAGMVGGFYGAAGDAKMKAELAAIEAALKASGLTAAEAKQMADQAMAGATIVSKFYGGGGGGGGGSGISTPGSGGGGGGGGDVWYV